MEKIKMPVPIAELDGDEMTHILWGMIKDQLIKPFVDLNTEYYDLSLPNRDRTEDAVTRQAAEAIKRLHVGVKCATITPNYQRQEEYGLKQLWKSPNATIRAALDGTVFRAPILISRVKPVVTCWKKPITIARHAYGDVYKAVEYRVPGPGKAELVFTDDHGAELSRQTVYDFTGPGVLQAMHNRDDSILSFARCCFAYALDVKQDVWFSSKDTISKDYDQTFKLLFQKVFDEEYRAAFDAAGPPLPLRPHRRRGCQGHPLLRRHHLGLQELRRRRDERPHRRRVRLAAHDDQRAGVAGRQFRVRGSPRHRHRPFLPLAQGREGVHQPAGDDGCMVRCPEKAGRAGWQRRAGAFCRLSLSGGAGRV